MSIAAGLAPERLLARSRLGAALVIVNPAASRVRPGIGGPVAHELARAGWEPEIVVVASREEIRVRAAAAVAEGVRLVTVVGGDGTVSEAAASLAGSGIPLAIVPRGTGNLLAGSLGISRRRLDSIRSLDGATERSIDLSELAWPGGRHVFAVAAGAGFDAAVMAATPPEWKRRIGWGAYVLTAVRRAGSFAESSYALTIDGARHETEAAVILVANCLDRVVGLVRPRVPIVPDDGLLDVFVVRARTPLHGIRSSVSLISAGPQAPSRHSELVRFHARELTIDASPAVPIELDGDVVGTTPVTARVLPGALRVLVPVRERGRLRR